MSYFQTRFKKDKRWICSCKRINDADESVCAFCGQAKEQKEEPKKAKGKAYDEIHLWPVFSLYVRLNNADTKGMVKCFTCGKSKHYTKVDCGHGIPRQYKATKYSEINNEPQCKSCNGFHGGMREVYKEEMDKKHGAGTWDKMKVASRGVFKLGKTEVDILTEYYKKEIEKIKSEKGL